MQKIFWTALLFFFLPAYVFAETADIPVELKADSFKFSENSEIVEAAGSVEVKFRDAVIRADRLTMDSATNIVTAEGHVTLTANNYQADAQSLVYDASRETASYSGFKSSIQTNKMRGPLYLQARQVLGAKNMAGTAGSLTSCDKIPEHWRLAAAKIEYYPNDRLQGENATMYIGRLPVLWLPYMYYDLHGRPTKNWTFGHNDTEGDFFKSAWGSPAGQLMLDYMSNKGIGYGLENAFSLAALGAGTFYLYHLNEKDTGLADWSTRLESEKQISPNTKLKFGHKYTSTYLIPAGRLDQTALALNLSFAKEKEGSWNLQLNNLDDRAGFYQKYALAFNRSFGRSAADYGLNYEYAKNTPQWFRNNQRFSLALPLAENIMFNGRANYYNAAAYQGDAGQERVEPQIELNGSAVGFTWRLSQNWFLDMRQDLYPGIQKYQFLEKQPEIEIYPKSFSPLGVNLQTIFGFGAYREVRYVAELGGNRDYRTQRGRATINASRQFPLGLGTNLSLGAGVDQFSYASGDQLYAYRESAGTATDLFSFFRNEMNYRKGRTDGNTPFLFDRLDSNYHDIADKLTFYYQDKFDWSWTGGKNWQAGKWFDVMTRLSYRPNQTMRYSLDSGWDIENVRYKDLVTAFSWAPRNFFSLDLAANQDLNGGGLKTGSALYELRFLEGEPNQTRLRVSQVFEAATKEFKVRDIMIVKDLHCWEMKYAYSDYRREFSFSLSLKAMPDQPLGYSSGRGFYFEGFNKIESEIRSIQSEGEVRRF